jgi:hypothetical protein
LNALGFDNSQQPAKSETKRICLLSRGSQVRVLPGAPARFCELAASDNPSGSAATRFARRERFRVLPGAPMFSMAYGQQKTGAGATVDDFVNVVIRKYASCTHRLKFVETIRAD